MGLPFRQILLVEDDDAVRDTLAELLTVEGYRVTAAANGREALDRAAAGERPGLILLDLVMPVMDGWAFRAAQRADPRLAAVPVIILSATHGAERAAMARLAPEAFLPKPVEFERLLDLVRCYVGAPRAARVAAGTG